MTSELSTLPNSKSYKTATSRLLLATSCLAVYLIFVLPLSSSDLSSTSDALHTRHGFSDDAPIERNHTEEKALDGILTALSAVVDGRDEALRLFMVWFMAQQPAVLVFSFWESMRAGGNRSLVTVYVNICSDYRLVPDLSFLFQAFSRLSHGPTCHWRSHHPIVFLVSRAQRECPSRRVSEEHGIASPHHLPHHFAGIRGPLCRTLSRSHVHSTPHKTTSVSHLAAFPRLHRRALANSLRHRLCAVPPYISHRRTS